MALRENFRTVVIGALASIASVVVIGAFTFITGGGLKTVLGEATKEYVLKYVETKLLDGAVVAFDHSAGCPPGWSKFTPATDRFVVGAGGEYRLYYEGGDAKYETGGNAELELKERHLPSHKHGIIDPGHIHIISVRPVSDVHDHSVEPSSLLSAANTQEGTGFSVSIGLADPIKRSSTDIEMEVTGDGESFSTVPPYVALYFCKKDADVP